VKWICAAGKEQKSNNIFSIRQSHRGLNHTLMQLSDREDFIEFFHHESLKKKKEQKLHELIYIVQENE